MATISIGLLIAIGLEQTVEYFHHRHTLARWEWMATTARARLVAALKAHASPTVLSVQEGESLQCVYGDFGVAMAGYRQRLKWTDAVLSMALANERIDIAAGRRHGISAHPD